MHSAIEAPHDHLLCYENQYDQPQSEQEDSFIMKMGSKIDQDESPTHNIDYETLDMNT